MQVTNLRTSRNTLVLMISFQKTEQLLQKNGNLSLTQLFAKYSYTFTSQQAKSMILSHTHCFVVINLLVLHPHAHILKFTHMPTHTPPSFCRSFHIFISLPHSVQSAQLVNNRTK